MFKKFLRTKDKSVSKKEKVEKTSKKNLKENKEEPEFKQRTVTQFPIKKLLTAEGWLRRQKNSF